MARIRMSASTEKTFADCSSQQKLDTVFKIMYQRTASIGQHMLSNLTRGIVPVSDSSASTPGAVR